MRFWLLAFLAAAWVTGSTAISLAAIYIGTGGLMHLLWLPYLAADRVTVWAWQGRVAVDGLVLRLGIAAWICIQVLESLVPFAAEHAALVPSLIPYTESGWGTVGAGAVGLLSMVLAGVQAGRVRESLLPPPPVVTASAWLERTPEPEEDWSPEVVEAWRAWRWTASTLQGVWSEWPTRHFEATCKTCPEGVLESVDADSRFLATWGSASFSMKRRDPTGTGHFTVLVFTASGVVYPSWLEQQTERAGIDTGIGYAFVSDLSAIVGIPVHHKQPDGLERAIPLADVVRNWDQIEARVDQLAEDIGDALSRTG